MAMQMSETTAELILLRIDTIMAELQQLRQQVVALEKNRIPLTEPTFSLVDELSGALGQGDWSEYDEFLEWERFAS